MRGSRRSPAAVLALLATLVVHVPGVAHAQLSHVGDGTGGAFGSWVNNPVNASNQIVFERFLVPAGQTWLPSTLFADFDRMDVDPSVTTLHWQIRTGMSPGAGLGHVVASGSGVASVAGDRFAVGVDGVSLTHGAYWVGLYADLGAITTSSTEPQRSFFGPMSTTGAGGTNAVLDGRALWLIEPDAALDGGFVEAIDHDVSLGIDGVSLTAAPEPGAWALLATGLLVIGVARRRRRAG